MPINTAASSARYRSLLIDHSTRRIRITNYKGSEQERDLSESPNCGGFGRIHHFSRHTSDGWVPNPLPIDPALRAFGSEGLDTLRAQVFQNAACNWRCWYCYVPFDLLAANPTHSDWLTAGEMLDMFLAQEDRPTVIDLSGGEPELTPEWVYWVLEELRNRELEHDVYVWSDDNLSTDYFWTHLSATQRERVTTFRNYGRVGCFKGIDEESFAYNTNASPEGFGVQFELMRRLVESGMDIYGYVTFTSSSARNVRDRVSRFVDRLQEVNEYLPLRTVPLEVRVFTPVKTRLNDWHEDALQTQWQVLDAWKRELAERFPSDLRARSVVDVPLVRP
jgi:uncharacterized Fe-S cluster-containing radical SAM superfamily protein